MRHTLVQLFPYCEHILWLAEVPDCSEHPVTRVYSGCDREEAFAFFHHSVQFMLPAAHDANAGAGGSVLVSGSASYTTRGADD